MKRKIKIGLGILTLSLALTACTGDGKVNKKDVEDVKDTDIVAEDEEDLNRYSTPIVKGEHHVMKYNLDGEANVTAITKDGLFYHGYLKDNKITFKDYGEIDESEIKEIEILETKQLPLEGGEEIEEKMYKEKGDKVETVLEKNMKFRMDFIPNLHSIKVVNKNTMDRHYMEYSVNEEDPNEAFVIVAPEIAQDPDNVIEILFLKEIRDRKGKLIETVEENETEDINTEVNEEELE